MVKISENKLKRNSRLKAKRNSLKFFHKLITQAIMGLGLNLISQDSFAVQKELLDELGFTKLHEKGYTGKGVPIIVTDMPVLTAHKAFKGQVEELYQAPQNPKEMYLAEGGQRVHGTHVSSIIKAQSNLKKDDKGAAFEAQLKTIGLPLEIAIAGEEDQAIWNKVLSILEDEIKEEKLTKLLTSLAWRANLKPGTKGFIISKMKELLEGNNLTFQDLIKMEDDMSESIDTTLDLWPDKIPQEQFDKERKTRISGFTLEEMKVTFPERGEQEILEYYTAAATDRKEFLKGMYRFI